MSNPFERKFTQFAGNLKTTTTAQKSELLTQRAGEVFADKPFTVEFRSIYNVAQVGQSLTQVVTFCTTAALGVFALTHIIPTAWGIYIAIPLGVAFAFGVEKVKRTTLQIAAKYYLKYSQLGAAGAVALLVMCVSIAAALYGAKELPGVIYPEPQPAKDGAAVAALDKDIERVQTDIERTTNKLSSTENWTAENRTLPRLQKERAHFVELRDAAAKEANERSATDHATAKAERSAKVEKLQIYSVSVAVVAELLFLLCTAFLLYYLFRQYAENEPKNEAPQEAPQTNQGAQTQAPVLRSMSANLVAEKPIYKVSAAPGATCDHCGTGYQKRTTFQKFCSEGCRVAAWEGRTGRTLKNTKS